MDEELKLKQWFSEAPIEMRKPSSEGEVAVSHPFFQGKDTSDPNSQGSALYSDPKNHANGVTSILAFCSAKTNFFPLTQTIEDNAKTYVAYANKVASFPGFTLVHADNTEATHNKADVDRLIEQIKEAYEGVVDVDLDKITTSIKNMVNSVVSQGRGEQEKCIFNQMVLKNDVDKFYLSMFKTTLKMKREDGKRTCASQKYTISRAKWEVNTVYFLKYADKLAKEIIDCRNEEWLKSNTTPTSAGIKTCFSDVAA